MWGETQTHNIVIAREILPDFLAGLHLWKYFDMRVQYLGCGVLCVDVQAPMCMYFS